MVRSLDQIKTFTVVGKTVDQFPLKNSRYTEYNNDTGENIGFLNNVQFIEKITLDVKDYTYIGQNPGKLPFKGIKYIHVWDEWVPSEDTLMKTDFPKRHVIPGMTKHWWDILE